VGQPLGNASRSLQDAGFRLGNVSVVVAATTAGDTANQASAAALVPAVPPAPVSPPAQATPASVIVSQVPGAGQKVVAGTAVNFEVR
jgi:hypothetical protein